MRQDKKTGIIWVVGIGPGSRSMMTQEAISAILAADVVVGYTTYINIVKKELFNSADLEENRQKTFLATSMRQEEERCRLCFEEAEKGKKVALVCSGDAGVYGMASWIFELSEEYAPCEISVISGVTAATAGAAMLGAPLGHDFCVISLSDLLTPWELIEKRLVAACEADFAIAIYNPSSKGRADTLKRACRILLPYMGENRPCGLVKNIGRDNTFSKVCTLKELMDEPTDMTTTVIFGNSMTQIIQGKLVTPRKWG